MLAADSTVVQFAASWSTRARPRGDRHSPTAHRPRGARIGRRGERGRRLEIVAAWAAVGADFGDLIERAALMGCGPQEEVDESDVIGDLAGLGYCGPASLMTSKACAR